MRKRIVGNISMQRYDSNDIVPDYLIKTSKNDFSSLTTLHLPIEEHEI